MSRVIVPPSSEIAEMTTDQLAALQSELRLSVASCQETIDRGKAVGRDVNGVISARLVYERGLAAVNGVLRSRAGELLVEYGPVRPIHDFVSAYKSVKSALRLVGLVEAEHRALDVWLNAAEGEAEDAAYDALLAAHEHTKAALAAGGLDDEDAA